MSVGWLFPGQGSQHKGMGAPLFARFPSLVLKADDVLGYSVRELCLNDSKRLRDTRYAQPAIFTVNALQYLARAEAGGTADFFAGHRLGEYSALFAAGILDFTTGLALVKECA